MSVAVDGLFDPRAPSLPIVDPKLKQFGRLWIDVDHIEPTKALKRWQCGTQEQPALCVLHQSGQCKGGSKCNQVHVHPGFMQEVRSSLHSRPFTNCCSGHGDMASKRSDFQALLKRRPVELLVAGNTVGIVPEWIAATTYFDCYLNETSKPTSNSQAIRICPSRVCNLHQRQACKYGSDCRNVHLCRDVWPQLSMHANPSPAAQGPVTVLPRHVHPLQGPVAQGLSPSQAVENPTTPVAGTHQKMFILQEVGIQGNQTPLSTPSAIPILLVQGGGQQALNPVFYSMVPVLQGPAPSVNQSVAQSPKRPSLASTLQFSVASTPIDPPKPSSASQDPSVRRWTGTPKLSKPVTDLSLLCNAQPQAVDPWAGNCISPPRVPASKRANFVPGLPEPSSHWTSSKPATFLQPASYTSFDFSTVSPPREDSDFEPTTPSAITAEELSAQEEDECHSDHLSGAEWSDAEEHPTSLPAAWPPVPLGDDFSQQTIFQSLTFDFLDDVATGIALPVIQELQQAVL